jgi:hypothetical protein
MEYQTRTYYRKEDLPEIPDSRFFHCASSFDWYAHISYYRPLMIVASDAAGKPVAAMSALNMRINRFLYGSVFKRCYVSQIPAYFDESVSQSEVFEALLGRLVKEVGRNVFFIEYRDLGNAIFGYKAFRENRFYSVKWINIRNSLRRPTGLWNQLSRTRKNQINKAKKKGATAEELTTTEKLPEIYHLIEKAKNWKISNRFPPYRYFENFFTHYVQNGKGKIILTRFQDKIIGGAIIGFEGKTAYCLYYWGKNKSYKQLNPSVFSIWSAMEIAANLGYERFDFMDSGFLNENAGKPRFLLQFGGLQKATRRWYRINWQWLNFFANKIYD